MSSVKPLSDVWHSQGIIMETFVQKADMALMSTQWSHCGISVVCKFYDYMSGRTPDCQPLHVPTNLDLAPTYQLSITMKINPFNLQAMSPASAFWVHKDSNIRKMSSYKVKIGWRVFSRTKGSEKRQRQEA